MPVTEREGGRRNPGAVWEDLLSGADSEGEQENRHANDEAYSGPLPCRPEEKARNPRRHKLNTTTVME